MTSKLLGRIGFSGEWNDQGHRTWNIAFLCETTSPDDGPSVVSVTTGLPTVGSTWVFGNENDPWAFCTPYMSITQVAGASEGEWTGLWVVRQRFTTTPMRRCQDTTITDPLMEPWKVRGSFTRSQREATRDRFGDFLVSSSMELLRGINEDYGGATVTLGKNFVSLPLYTATQVRYHVNSGTMWGLPARTVKLVGFEFERNLYGVCTFYYTCSYSFEIDFEGWDKTVADRGTRTLVTGGTLGNLKDYRAVPDGREVFLDGAGAMATTLAGVGTATPQVAKQTDFLSVLGVPATF